MRDCVGKIVLFPTLSPSLWAWWKKEVWTVDLDSQMCCGGQMCGCRGSTWRSMYAHYNRLFRFVAGN